MWILSIFLVLMGIIIGLLLNDRINKPLEKMSVYETAKIICLLIPTIMSSIILVGLFFSDIVSIETGGLGIFGILATVWLGLNIYNFIEKRELENLNRDFNDIKIKTEKNIEIQEDLMGKLKMQKEEYKNEIDKLQSQLLESERNNYIQSTVALAEAINDEEREITYYNDIVERYPDDKIGYRYRIKYYRKLNNHKKVIEDFNQIIKIDPLDFTAYNDRGNAKKNDGNINEAIIDYNKAIELNPNLPQIYSNRGLAKRYINEIDSAISDFNKSIELDPNYVVGYNCRGGVKMLKEEYLEAIKDYDKVIELDPSNKLSYKNKGNACFKIAENVIFDKNIKDKFDYYKDAKACFEKYLTFDKDNDEVIKKIGIIESKLSTAI